MLSTNKIKYIRSLHQKKYRQKYSQFLVEGVKTIQEFINQGWLPAEIYHRSDFKPALHLAKYCPVLELKAIQLDQISSFKTAPELIGLFDYPASGIQLDPNIPFIVLDNISDPGNLGTIIRIADWFGVKQLLISPKTVDEFNPKSIAATMGSLARVQIIRTELIPALKDYNYGIYTAVLGGMSIYDKLSVGKRFCLVIGSESHGINEQLLKDLDSINISIPKIGNAESLNAAVATGILMDRLLNG